VRIPAKRELQALELDQQIGRREIGLQLERRIEEVRLVEGVTRRGVVQRGDADDLADGAKLGDRRPEGDGRLADVSPKADEGAHSLRTLAEAPVSG
jgi:hypothetical protein